MNSIGTPGIEKKYLTRHFNAGSKKQNMMGVAGDAFSRQDETIRPYLRCVCSRRAYDQVFLSIGYAKNNVRVIGSDQPSSL